MGFGCIKRKLNCELKKELRCKKLFINRRLRFRDWHPNIKPYIRRSNNPPTNGKGDNNNNNKTNNGNNGNKKTSLKKRKSIRNINNENLFS